jgi:hypothetical protein
VKAQILKYLPALVLGAHAVLGIAYAAAEAEDPFMGLEAASVPTQSYSGRTDKLGFFQNNFTFKKEVYSQFSYGPEAAPDEEEDRLYSRQSVGFEILKKFSTATATIGSFNIQTRLVRRDHFIPVTNDEEGEGREGWFAEYHNAYIDLYNILHPLLSDELRSTATGHFNFRLGRFYLPFGLNLQTDTHGTLLQLSNDRNFGFERDWYAGFWGSITPKLNYDLYYLLGSGYDPSFGGQDGMRGGRISLSNFYLNEYGLEGGLSVLAGQRRSKHALEPSSGSEQEATDDRFIRTKRFGADVRYSHLIPTGSTTGTAEISAGEDLSECVFTQLYQIEYLNRSRTWGLGSQYRRFYQDRDLLDHKNADSSIIGEATWFFRNDIGNSNLHWIKLNIERQLERMEGTKGTVTTLQYYRYW